MSGIHPPPPSFVASLWALAEDVSQQWVISISILVMHANMALQIIWSGIPVLLVFTEGTDVPGRSVDKAVSVGQN